MFIIYKFTSLFLNFRGVLVKIFKYKYFIVRQLRQDHSNEIHQLEVELADIQQSVESQHAGIVEAKNAENLARTEILSLKDHVAELESELARLRLENEELKGANSTLKDASEAESAKLNNRIHLMETELEELIKKQQAAENYGGESGIEEDGMTEVIIGCVTIFFGFRAGRL